MKTLKRTSSEDLHFQRLVVLLDEDLARRDGDEHAFYHQFNKLDNLKHVVLCYDDDEPVGCGAFKEYDKMHVEIKRMYVLPEYRGHGIGLMLLQELEKWAAEQTYPSTILETGKKQPEAISLYKKAGYTITGNYGQYENVANSVCMMKAIL